MTTIDGARPDVDHQHVLNAAIAELATTNAGSFTMTAVAKRAGVDVQDIKRVWPNTPELLNAALQAFAGQNMPVPDTGSLREDMLQYARLFAYAVNSPIGRRLVGAVVATPNEWDVSGWRETFFESRQRRVEPMRSMLSRAVERGECAPDLDALRIMDLLNAGLCISLQLYDRPVTDEDCEFVVDTLLNGIRGNR